nr:hypothetical protein [Tanacetum cinerariifolium]
MHSFDSFREITNSSSCIFPKVKFPSYDPVVHHSGHDIKRRVEESSSFRMISINITSPSSSLVQTSSALGDGVSNPSDSKSELNLRTFLVRNEIDGSAYVKELEWLFGLSLSYSLFSLVMSSRESLCSLGWLVMALIERVPAIRSVVAFNTVSILLVILLCCCLKSALNLDSVTEIVLLGLKGIPLTSRFIGTQGCIFSDGFFGIFHVILSVVGTTADSTRSSNFVHLEVVSEQDVLSSSVELDFRARLGGGFFGVEVTKLTTGRLINGSSCDEIDMVIKNLNLDPKVDAMMRDFLDPSRWKELSKESGSKILSCGDGSCWKAFKLIACLIA